MTRTIRSITVLMSLVVASCLSIGCDREIMEADTPAGDVEIEEEMDGGIEAEVEG